MGPYFREPLRPGFPMRRKGRRPSHTWNGLLMHRMVPVQAWKGPQVWEASLGVPPPSIKYRPSQGLEGPFTLSMDPFHIERSLPSQAWEGPVAFAESLNF